MVPLNKNRSGDRRVGTQVIVITLSPDKSCCAMEVSASTCCDFLKKEYQ